MKDKFIGYYHKLQKNNNTIAFIPSLSNEGRFLQIITNDCSYNMLLPKNNIFSLKGISVNIKNENINIKGLIRYSKLTPLKYDIMGLFKYLPMECRHGVISMHHKLSGKLNINNNIIDFADGTGYLEYDMGASFPKSYVWLQCNAFKEKASIMISIADIPFGKKSFKGCICIINYKGEEFRLATYLFVKILKYNREQIILSQGKYLFIIDLMDNNSHQLIAPQKGNMIRTIKESHNCISRFRFFISDKQVFDLKSNYCSFEYVENTNILM